jgi:prepilin-type N-terminal cleavage/methylation domain-containing protein
MKATKRGYTLVELAAGVAILLVIALILTSMVNTTVHTLATARRDANLAGEAAILQGVIQRLVGPVIIYSVHTSYADAQTGANAQSSGAWLRLVYAPLAPGSPFRPAIVGLNGGNLGFYRANPASGSWPAENAPNWIAARNLGGISFDGTNMMLRMSLTWNPGPTQTIYTVGIDPL